MAYSSHKKNALVRQHTDTQRVKQNNSEARATIEIRLQKQSVVKSHVLAYTDRSNRDQIHSHHGSS